MKKQVKSNPKPFILTSKKSSYEKDYYKWTQQQISSLKKRAFEKIDIENLIEEIESLGISQRKELRSHIRNLLHHLLKMKFQPEKKSKSWKMTIFNSRIEIRDCLKDSPSLKKEVNPFIKEVYPDAVKAAVNETGLETKIFPKSCPWTFAEMMDDTNPNP